VACISLWGRRREGLVNQVFSINTLKTFSSTASRLQRNFKILALPLLRLQRLAAQFFFAETGTNKYVEKRVTDFRRGTRARAVLYPPSRLPSPTTTINLSLPAHHMALFTNKLSNHLCLSASPPLRFKNICRILESECLIPRKRYNSPVHYKNAPNH
jgi:hypothetical protein